MVQSHIRSIQHGPQLGHCSQESTFPSDQLKLFVGGSTHYEMMSYTHTLLLLSKGMTDVILLILFYSLLQISKGSTFKQSLSLNTILPVTLFIVSQNFDLFYKVLMYFLTTKSLILIEQIYIIFELMILVLDKVLFV